MPNHTSLASLFSDIADAIRAKTGSSDQIVADNFPTAIADIPTGTIDSVTATPSTNVGSLSFQVAGEPKAFVCNIDGSSDIVTNSNYVLTFIYDGQNISGWYGFRLTSGNQAAYYSLSASGYTMDLSGNTLTISAANGHYFRANRTYKLLYIY